MRAAAIGAPSVGGRLDRAPVVRYNRPSPEAPGHAFRGAVAQLGERLTGSQEVDGSIPFSSTISISRGGRQFHGRLGVVFGAGFRVYAVNLCRGAPGEEHSQLADPFLQVRSRGDVVAEPVNDLETLAS